MDGSDAGMLHRRAVVLDAHIDTVLDIVKGRDILVRSDQGHVDLPRLEEGGVDVQVFALFIEPEYKPERALAQVLRLWDALHRTIDSARGRMALVTSELDLDRALAAGRLAAILSVEGGEAIGQDLANLRVLAALGVRAMGLTWNERNAIADGAGEAADCGGLTRFGRQVVHQMHQLGMVVDVSHLNERSFWDVLGCAEGPIIASHSNARALCDHPRNLRDEQIVALAKAGGVMGMNFYADFLTSSGPQAADIEQVVRHIDHISELVGPGHVGLGSDFDGISRTPRGLEDASRFPALTAALLHHGYSDDHIIGILGGNFLSVFRRALRSAAAAPI